MSGQLQLLYCQFRYERERIEVPVRNCIANCREICFDESDVVSHDVYSSNHISLSDFSDFKLFVDYFGNSFSQFFGKY